MFNSVSSASSSFKEKFTFQVGDFDSSISIVASLCLAPLNTFLGPRHVNGYYFYTDPESGDRWLVNAVVFVDRPLAALSITIAAVTAVAIKGFSLHAAVYAGGLLCGAVFIATVVGIAIKLIGNQYNNDRQYIKKMMAKHIISFDELEEFNHVGYLSKIHEAFHLKFPRYGYVQGGVVSERRVYLFFPYWTQFIAIEHKFMSDFEKKDLPIPLMRVCSATGNYSEKLSIFTTHSMGCYRAKISYYNFSGIYQRTFISEIAIPLDP